MDRLRVLYRADTRPWVVAFSGGKDSTVVLQLVFRLLQELGREATKPVIVLSSDTQVEAPNVAAFVQETLGRIQDQAMAQGLPLVTQLVRPNPDESYWGKLLGKGYPPPTRWFRWCTSNMKIKPSRRAVEEVTRTHGSVILLLGTRIDESSLRGRTMQARALNSKGLNPHHEIPNALVATPIADWTTDEVWEYLGAGSWGGDPLLSGDECGICSPSGAVSSASEAGWHWTSRLCRGARSWSNQKWCYRSAKMTCWSKPLRMRTFTRTCCVD